MRHGHSFLAALLLCCATAGQASEGELVGYLPFATVAPQDIAYDGDDASYWVTAFLDNTIYHYGAGLKEELGRLVAPLGANRYLTGIAFNSIDHTLLVVDAINTKIVEISRDGAPTGREIDPELKPVVNPNAIPTMRGLAFDRHGDGGFGSVYIVEALGTLIYEVGLDGRLLRYFNHPDDPDGFPGKGRSAPTSDIDVIYDGDNLEGFYVTGGQGRVSSLRRLDADGNYTGITISLEDAGGNVSGVIRRPFENPETGELSDSYVCVVESNARFAILEGGEPTFKEVLGFTCEASDDEVELSWVNPQVYDGIEIRDGCDVLALLPGDATQWRTFFEVPGVHRVSLRAFQGEWSSQPPTCTVVVGGGEVLSSAPVAGDPPEDMLPLDIATDGQGLILVSTNTYSGGRLNAKILIFDLNLSPLGSMTIGDALAGPEDYVSGIAYSRQGTDEFIYLFNASTSTVGVLDSVGAVITTFKANLPNLEKDPEAEPYLGFVVGMTYDADGAGGQGSLWLAESERGWIYEIDFAGNVVADFPHPYRAVELPPADSPYTIPMSGISEVLGNKDQLYLSGGALRDVRQPHIFRVDKKTGNVIPGSVIPTDGINIASTNYFFLLEHLLKEGKPRLMVVTLAGSDSRLLEVRPDLPPVPPPTFLEARQPNYVDAALLRFVNNGPYDKLEVRRDCEKIAEIPGDSASYLDEDVSAGLHEYSVRAVKGASVSEWVEASVRIGPGAVLQKAFLWPARSPQQLAQDPVEGSYAVVVNYSGDERKLYQYDRNFEYIATRQTVVQAPWQIAAVAVRVRPDGERELNYITWKQPVAIGDVASQQFFLVKESWSGDFLGETEISPPRPTNGFVTFPTGLTWDAGTDTFYYLERNSKTFVQMAPDGKNIRTFPHPAPPFQNFVFNLGADVVPERGTIFMTGAEKYDHRITKVREMTLQGAITGVEVPFDGVPNSITGIAVSGPDLIAVGSYSFSEIFRIKAFPELPPPFIRGDSDRNGIVELTDAVATLGHLFKGEAPPPCLDGADADDSSVINITDAIVTLLRLFVSGPPLPPPYPEPGLDPTVDGLPCP